MAGWLVACQGATLVAASFVVTWSWCWRRRRWRWRLSGDQHFAANTMQTPNNQFGSLFSTDTARELSMMILELVVCWWVVCMMWCVVYESNLRELFPFVLAQWFISPRSGYCNRAANWKGNVVCAGLVWLVLFGSLEPTCGLFVLCCFIADDQHALVAVWPSVWLLQLAWGLRFQWTK